MPANFRHACTGACDQSFCAGQPMHLQSHTKIPTQESCKLVKAYTHDVVALPAMRRNLVALNQG